MAQLIKYYNVHHEENPLPEVTMEQQKGIFYSDEQLKALHDAAYQQGYHSGQEDAHAHIAQEMVLLKEQLNTLVQQIPTALEQARLQLQPEIAAVTLLIIQRYFVEQAADIHNVEHKINHLLGEMNQQQSIELCLHPRDIHALQSAQIQLQGSKKQITIKTDETLALGGFIIKTEHGVFDSSIERQINKLKEYLLDLQRRPNTP